MSADTKPGKILVVTVDHYPMHDESPSDTDGWKVYSFNRRHTHYKEPESVGLTLELGEDGFPGIEDADLKAKFEKGLAFFLSYSEHGLCNWEVNQTGKLPFDWDRTSIGGLLVWEEPEDNIGAKTFEDRLQDAKKFTERYTMWCNGESYEYGVEGFTKCSECGHDKDGEDLESGCGYIGSDDLESAVNETISELLADDDWKDAEVRVRDKLNILNFGKLTFKDRIIGRKKKA